MGPVTHNNPHIRMHMHTHTRTSLVATCVSSRTFLFIRLLVTHCAAQESVLRHTGIRCWSASQCTRLNLFPLVQKEGRWLCNLHHCPAAKSALSARVSSSCLCSPTACNESSLSEPWHAQMINWWQRELIKEIKLGTQ